MAETLTSILVFGFLIYLISLLYVLPSYFRRLGSLIAHLESNHVDTYSKLGRPSLSMLDMNIRSTFAIVMFILRKRYLELNDDGATELGNAARWRLIYGMLPAVLPPFAFAAIVLSNAS